MINNLSLHNCRLLYHLHFGSEKYKKILIYLLGETSCPNTSITCASEKLVITRHWTNCLLQSLACNVPVLLNKLHHSNVSNASLYLFVLHFYRLPWVVLHFLLCSCSAWNQLKMVLFSIFHVSIQCLGIGACIGKLPLLFNNVPCIQLCYFCFTSYLLSCTERVLILY